MTVRIAPFNPARRRRAKTVVALRSPRPPIVEAELCLAARSPWQQPGIWSSSARRALPWVAAQGISTHWLRHTTLTWVERHFGNGVARAYVGVPAAG